MNDPLFAVDVHAQSEAANPPRETTVKVELGYIELSRRPDGSAVIVGPLQQLTVPHDADPQTDQVRRIVLTPTEAARFSNLQRTAPTPKPDFTRPDQPNSAALNNLFTRGSLVVGVALPAGKQLDPQTSTFVTDLFTFLAKSWGVTPVIQPPSTPAAIAKDLGRRIDLTLTQDLTGFGQFDEFPLFVDGTGALWRVVSGNDDIFDLELRHFFAGSVSDDKYYGTFYRRAFGKEPSYSDLGPLLFGS